MKTKLSGIDRLNIFDILPQKEGRIKMILITEISDILKITGEETVEFNLKDALNGGIEYNYLNPKLNTDKDFDLKAPHIEVLKEAVIELDKNKAWTPQNKDTCIKIEKLK